MENIIINNNTSISEGKNVSQHPDERRRRAHCDREKIRLSDYSDIMRVPEVSEVLGVCPNLVYGLLHRGEIAYRRIGSRIIIPRLCVEDFIESIRTSNRPEAADACRKGEQK